MDETTPGGTQPMMLSVAGVWFGLEEHGKGGRFKARRLCAAGSQKGGKGKRKRDLGPSFESGPA